jgi:alpha-beta hydrolase superfamily lysophospholipase
MSQTSAPSATWPDLFGRLVTSNSLGCLAAAYTASRWLTRPTPGRPRRTPADHGWTWERLDCRTADGVRLAGWCVAPAHPRATVILFHGLHHGREQTLGRTAVLVRAGYRCVAFDHRAHGESTGKRTSFGYHEGQDVAAVLDLARRNWPRQPLAALGISMGAAALCFAADHVRSCTAVVLESLYHDIAAAFESRVTEYPPWFARLSRAIFRVTERRLGVRLDALAPVDHIGRLAPAPVLLLTGEEDPNAPPADARRLLDRCRGPRELCVVPGAGHKDVFETGGQLYEACVLDFLERWLRPAPLPRVA